MPSPVRKSRLPGTGTPALLMALACALLAVPGEAQAGRWKLTGKSSETNFETGNGRVKGPVSLSSEEWSFTASREAMIRAKASITKTQAEGEKPRYKLDTKTACFVFFGQCEARNREGKVVLKGPFMTFDVAEDKLIGQGPGVTYLDADGALKALQPGTSVSIDLESGVPVLEAKP